MIMEIFMSKLALRRKIYNFDEKCWIFRDFWVKIGFSHCKIPSKNPSTIFSPFNFFKHIKSFKHFESHYFFNLSTTWNLPPRWKIINLSSQIGFQCGKFSSKEFFSHRADLKSIFYFSIYFFCWWCRKRSERERKRVVWGCFLNGEVNPPRFFPFLSMWAWLSSFELEELFLKGNFWFSNKFLKSWATSREKGQKIGSKLTVHIDDSNHYSLVSIHLTIWVKGVNLARDAGEQKATDWLVKI